MYSRLNLSTEFVNKSVLGINNCSSPINKRCRVEMKSLNGCFATKLQCFVLPSITDAVPTHQVDLSNLNIPTDICLADPYFYTPSDVDMIIGADLFWDLLGCQKIKLGDGQPILCETELGWLVSGPITSRHGSTTSTPIRCNFLAVNSDSATSKFDDDIQNQLTRFWQLEEVSHQSSHYSHEEKLCEEHFKANTVRLNNGSFSVRLPLKQSPNLLGDSYQRAKHCFLALERRWKNRPLFKKMYTDFMSEYHALGHMSEFVPTDLSIGRYHIPHHGILRESSTTKLRAVFNASSPSSTGISLNDLQMVGPTVQDDLLSLLIRFRQHKYVISGDIEKMYRTVLVHPADRSLQLILWRENESDILKTYQLNTVSHGTASAPFLATRCLKQIGLDCKDKNLSEMIIHDFMSMICLAGVMTSTR
jgi:hypothetical protein